MPAPPQLLGDVAALQALGHDVAISEEPPRFYVLISDLELPPCYEPRTTTLMMMADYQYPMSALDMFWTDPDVRRADNGSFPQNADSIEQHISRSWQRWSWHYGGWDPSVHSVLTHLEVFFDRLARAK